MSSSRFRKRVIIKKIIAMKKEKQVKNLYQAPKVEFIDLCASGVLCASGEDKELEDLVEYIGSWGN